MASPSEGRSVSNTTEADYGGRALDVCKSEPTNACDVTFTAIRQRSRCGWPSMGPAHVTGERQAQPCPSIQLIVWLAAWEEGVCSVWWARFPGQAESVVPTAPLLADGLRFCVCAVSTHATPPHAIAIGAGDCDDGLECPSGTSRCDSIGQ